MQAEVLVLGSGPAGSSTAYFMAKNGVQVLLVDRQGFPREKVCGGGLSPAAVRILTRMGVLDGGEETRGDYRFFAGVRIFAPDGSSVRLNYPFRPRLGGARRGCVVRRVDLDQRLLERAVAAGAQFMPHFRAVGPIRTSGPCCGGLAFLPATRGRRSARSLGSSGPERHLSIPRGRKLSLGIC